MITHVRSSLLTVGVIICGTAIGVKLHSAGAPAPRTYVGEQTCMKSSCHENGYGDSTIYKGAAAFRQTMHQKIHLRPNPQTVILEKYFAGDSVLADRIDNDNQTDTLKIYLSKSPDGKEYFAQMRLAASGDSTPKMRVEYTYGGNGWIQRYLVSVSDGHLMMLPFQYILPRYADRSDTSNAFYFLDVKRWLIGDPNVGKVTFFKWNTNLFRFNSWDVACAACHLNGFSMQITGSPDTTRVDTVSTTPLTLDTVTVSRNDSSWTALWAGKGTTDQDINMSIGCESCHGPGSEHAAHPTLDNIVSPRKFGNSAAGIDLKLYVCDQCHNRSASTGNVFTFPFDDKAGQSYQPGLDLRNYLYGRDLFAGAQIWPDSTSSAHHQQGQDFAKSKEYTGHTFQDGCYSCHSVHYNTRYPYQLDRNWYSLKRGEGCLTSGCHETFDSTVFRADIGKVVNKHTQHVVASSQCVNCHFTKSATIGFTQLPHKPYNEFAAHNFKVISPWVTITASNNLSGVPNTCAANCHRNGRAARNFEDSALAAPDFGVFDDIISNWGDSTDVQLADSLWYHYKIMFKQFLSAPEESSHSGTRDAITSVNPNPTAGGTTTRFSISSASDIQLEVYDLQGRPVRLLAAGMHSSGHYVRTWDGRDESGNPLPRGTYFVRLTTKRGISSQQVILVR